MTLRSATRDASIGRTIRLRDGRVLGFAEFGDSAGRALFFFHGGGSGRLTRHPDDSILQELGVRLVTIDRPGVGLSDCKPGRRLLEWPDDTQELADRLGIDRFSVLGWSAGGPHALACAYKIPHRLLSAGVMSGLAPFHWPGLRPAAGALLARVSLLTRQCKRVLREPAGRAMEAPVVAAQRLPLRLAGDAFPSSDSLDVPREVRAINRQRLRDIVRAREWERLNELAMLAAPWGFRLQDISMEVHLWHGARDATTPLYMAQYLERTIPSALLTVWPGEGHHAGFTHWRETVGTLLGRREADLAG